MLVPKLRFKFEDETDYPEWKTSTLSTITEKVERKAIINSDAPIMMISQGNGFINQSEKYSRENAGQSLKNYTLLKNGEFAYNHGASKAKPFGVTYCLSEEKEALVPFVYHTFSLLDGDRMYWNYALNTVYVDRQLRKLVSSGARMDGLLNISYSTYMNIDINIPCIEEQKRISGFLSSVDCVICSIRDELTNRELQMKAMLQKLFTKEVLFGDKSEHNDDWATAPICKIANVSGGKTPSMSDSQNWDEPTINWVSSKDMKTSRISESEMKISNYALKEMRLFDPGTILMVARSGILKHSLPVAILNNPSTINQDIKAFEVFGCMPEFFYYYLKSKETFILHNYSKSGTTVQSIQIDDLLQLEMPIPDRDKQGEIVELLSDFETVVELTKKELLKWEELKKGLLQQMFV